MTERDEPLPAEIPVVEQGLPPLGPPPPARPILARELAVVLFILVPSLVLSLLALHGASLGFVTVAVGAIFQDLALVSLVAYFFWRNGEGLAALGWRGPLLGEAVVGMVLFVPTFFAAGGLEKLLARGGMSSPSHLPSFLKPTGEGQMVLAVFLVVVVAVVEETIFRGYLLRRFAQLTASPIAAVLLSAAIFSLGHSYEGTAGMATVGFLGVIFAAVYLWRGSLVAPIVMHLLQDIIGLVIVPLVSR
jgi:membrane protease YdiL (CAAX protease family)